MTTQKAWLLVDLGFGDQGKGSIVDFLTRSENAHTVIRFNGGAQAAHNVIAPDGRHHRFRQFGSGTFVEGVKTYLSRFMLVSPWSLIYEEELLQKVGVIDAFERTTISEAALVITPFHQAANRLRELARGEGRHGSCGMGIGETQSDANTLSEDLIVHMRDLNDLEAFAKKLRRVQIKKLSQLAEDGVLAKVQNIEVAREELEILTDMNAPSEFVAILAEDMSRFNIVPENHLGTIFSATGTIIFEPAQGVLLDEIRGFHPYTTWSNCTLDNALKLLEEFGYKGEVEKLGVVRAYSTRHGAGPFVTESVRLTECIPDVHNENDDWQKGFRVGHFDAVATRYAIEACGGIDSIALTCLDRLAPLSMWSVCAEYEVLFDKINEQFFAFSRSNPHRIKQILLGPRGDLDHQTGLTKRLFKAKMITSPSTSTEDTFGDKVTQHAKRIADELDTKIRIVSFGPKASDKHFF